MAEVLTKPIDANRLRQVLAQLERRRHLERRRPQSVRAAINQAAVPRDLD